MTSSSYTKQKNTLSIPFFRGHQAEKMAYKYKPIKDEILGSDSEGK